MRFEPKTEKEIADSRVLPKGTYEFEIEEAQEKTSNAGNDMFVLTVRVSNGNGLSRTLPDYLLPKRAEKFRNCCAACGLLDKYEGGVLSDDDFVARRGRCRIGVEKKKGFPDRNMIEDYLAA